MKIIVDIREAREEFDRRIAPYQITDHDYARLVDMVWYCLIHETMADSLLISLACQMKEQGSTVFYHAIHPFGQVLRSILKPIGFYRTDFNIQKVHFCRLLTRNVLMVEELCTHN